VAIVRSEGEKESQDARRATARGKIEGRYESFEV